MTINELTYIHNLLLKNVEKKQGLYKMARKRVSNERKSLSSDWETNDELEYWKESEQRHWENLRLANEVLEKFENHDWH